MARTNSRVDLEMYVNKMIDGVPHLARTHDISRGGVRVHKLLEPMAREDAHIALEFVLPGTGEVIWAEATLVHEDKRAVGLKFINLAPRDGALIQAYVDRAPTN